MKGEGIAQAVLLAAVLAGVLFRLVSLDAGDLWYDEARQFWRAKGIAVDEMTVGRRPLADTLRLNASTNLEPPLMTTLLHYWSRAGDSLAWLRLLPCLLGIVALPLMYGSALALGMRRTGALLVTALCSLSLPWVYYSLDLKAYALSLACTSLVILLTVRMLGGTTGGIARYGALSAAICAGCLSIYGFWLLLPFLCGTVLIRILSDPRLRWRGTAGALWFFFTPLLLALAFALTHQQDHFQRGGSLIWYIEYLKPYWEKGLGACAVRFAEFLAGMLSWQLAGVKVRFCAPSGVLLAALLLLLVPLIVSAMVREWRRGDLSRCWVIAGFLYGVGVCTALSIMARFPLGPVRQNLFLSPFLMLSCAICACGPRARNGQPRNRWAALAAALAAALLLGSSMYAILDLRSRKFDRADIRGLVRRVEERVCADGDRPAYLYADEKTHYTFKYHYLFSASRLRERIPPRRVRLSTLLIWTDRRNWLGEIEDMFAFAGRDAGGSCTQWYLLSGASPWDYSQSLKDYARIEDFLAGRKGVSGIETIDALSARALRVDYRAPSAPSIPSYRAIGNAIAPPRGFPHASRF